MCLCAAIEVMNKRTMKQDKIPKIMYLCVRKILFAILVELDMGEDLAMLNLMELSMPLLKKKHARNDCFLSVTY